MTFHDWETYFLSVLQ